MGGTLKYSVEHVSLGHGGWGLVMAAARVVLLAELRRAQLVVRFLDRAHQLQAGGVCAVAVGRSRGQCRLMCSKLPLTLTHAITQNRAPT